MTQQSNLTPLPIPVPDALEEAVGYTGEGSWFAMYWRPAGDEVVLADRWNEYTGEWAGYLAYIRHHTVARHLDGYNLGNSDEPPDHWLLIHREARKAYIAPAEAACDFLSSLPDPMPEFNRQIEQAIETGGINAVLDIFRARRAKTAGSIGEHLTRQKEKIARLKDSLDTTERPLWDTP